MILLGVPVLAGAFLLVEAGFEHLRAPTFLARAAGTGCGYDNGGSGHRGRRVHGRGVVSSRGGLWHHGAALGAQTVMYVVFTAHLSWRRYRGDESGGGCNRMGTQVGPGGIARAVLLAIAALLENAGPEQG
jgi:hypothetical protein